MNNKTIYLTLEQMMEAKKVRQWAADQRFNRAIKLLEAQGCKGLKNKPYAEALVEALE